jgi:hypothetical protein
MSVGVLVTSIVNYFSGATEFGEGKFFCKFTNRIRAFGFDSDPQSSRAVYKVSINPIIQSKPCL